MAQNGVLNAQRIYTKLTRLRDVVNRLCKEADQLRSPRPLYFPLDQASALIHEAQEAAWVWMQELSKPADPKADTAILPRVEVIDRPSDREGTLRHYPAPPRQVVTG